MRAVALSLALASSMLVLSSSARAADFLFGVGSVNELVGFNFEVSGSAGSGYLLLGTYQARTGYQFLDNPTVIAGYRWYQEGKYNASGYFGGVFAGDIDGGPTYTRYGGGGEVGYQWITHHLRFAGHAGMALAGAASGVGLPAINADATVPRALLGASVDMRF